MIGLDTNVLVRYIVQDDEVQASRASNLLESRSEESPGFISHVVLVELVWVLRRAYRLSQEDILHVMRLLFRTRSLVVENAALAIQAMELYARGNADFSDCLVMLSARAAGCEQTFTFDSIAARDAHMNLL